MRARKIVAVLCLLAMPAMATERNEVMVPVHAFIDNVNENRMDAAANAYAPEASIIDEFPPHYWHGTDAFSDWGRDFEIDAKKHDVTDPHITLGKPRHVVVDGNFAYVVVPASFAFKEHGKPATETDSTMTFALRRGESGWRIAAWSWTKH